MIQFLPLVAQALPHLAGLLATPLRDSVLGKAANIAEQIFQTRDAEQVKLQMKQDEEKTKRFVAQMEHETAEEQAFYADLQNARQFNVRMTELGSPQAWGAPLMSALVTFGFFFTIAIFLTAQLDTLSEFQKTVLNVLIGYLGAGFQQALNYWLGSTRDSQNKTGMLASLASTAQNVTNRVVETVSGTGNGKMFK